MAVPTTTKEARLVATLTELSSTGRLRWTLKTPSALRAGKAVPAHLRFCYETDFGDSYLVLYDNSAVSPLGLGIGVVGASLEALMGGKYVLSIVNKASRDETLQLSGRVLNDLYATVQSKAGDADSVIDDLLQTARGF
ncbi:hypothetical protein ACNPPY_04715 [Achromobacter sp. AGC78]